MSTRGTLGLFHLGEGKCEQNYLNRGDMGENSIHHSCGKTTSTEEGQHLRYLSVKLLISGTAAMEMEKLKVRDDNLGRQGERRALEPPDGEW